MDRPADHQRIALLLAELRLAITFLEIARGAWSDEVRLRNINNAQRARAVATKILGEGLAYSAADQARITRLASDFALLSAG
jgi:hypothetical protein